MLGRFRSDAAARARLRACRFRSRFSAVADSGASSTVLEGEGISLLEEIWGDDCWDIDGADDEARFLTGEAVLCDGGRRGGSLNKDFPKRKNRTSGQSHVRGADWTGYTRFVSGTGEGPSRIGTQLPHGCTNEGVLQLAQSSCTVRVVPCGTAMAMQVRTTHDGDNVFAHGQTRFSRYINHIAVQ